MTDDQVLYRVPISMGDLTKHFTHEELNRQDVGDIAARIGLDIVTSKTWEGLLADAAARYRTQYLPYPDEEEALPFDDEEYYEDEDGLYDYDEEDELYWAGQPLDDYEEEM